MRLYVLRGLPGAGKSTLARHLASTFPGEEVVICSADDYFLDAEGRYAFDPRQLGQAHATAQSRAIFSMARGVRAVVVDNTNTQRWEWLVYATAAEALGYDVRVVSVFDGGLSDQELFDRGTHGVPLAAITAMRGRWEGSKDASVLL